MLQVQAESWHDRSLEELAASLAADRVLGLTTDEAASRLARHGPNELRKGDAVAPLAILAAQFESLVIWVLIGAALVSVALGEAVDGAAIIAIVVLNAIIGFFQEYRAEKAAAALARLAAPRARVVRDGRAQVLRAADVVPGDVLLLEAGDLVAADCRLIDASVLRTTEAALTGESEPVEKRTGMFPRATPISDRRNMVFLGTSVAAGSGRALVVATGMGTEIGHIARLLETASDDATPLQRRLDQVAKRLLWACLVIVALVFGLGVLRGVAPFDLFLSAVSLAVAAVPEGLPAVVTVALALGVQRMVRRNALVRRLPAVETLGCAQVICTDKTGTLTVGEMTARKLVTHRRLYRISGEGYHPEGAFFSDDAEIPVADDPLLFAALQAAVACNDAELQARAGRSVVVGDPTEGALLVAGAKGGLERPVIEADLPRLRTLPFDSDRKRMTIVRGQAGSAAMAFVKGAPEVILERCTQVLTDGGTFDMSASDRSRMQQAAALMANDALRVLALARRPLTVPAEVDDTDRVETGLTLLGLIGLQDPPRPEAREAVARCRRAGIKPVMITGDHPDTARAIARELGVLDTRDGALLGMDLDRMTDAELVERVHDTGVYARVTAEHKLRIVRAWKARGAIVAMTGDGVNDAPALKEASIGVAMGITGTEVTKEAADIIITDDNFASIVAAVEEGRGIYDNIAKTLAYLLAGNAGELTVMLIAALAGWPLPLLPLHLLWINLVTDGLPALALATDPVDPGVLNRPPRRPEAQMMDREFLRLTALTGILTAGVTVAAFAYEYYIDGSLEQARDAAFTVLVIAELLRSFGARSSTLTVWQIGLLSNIRLFLIVLASFSLQIAIHHVGALQVVFGIEPITLTQCVTWAGLGLVPFLVLEVAKVLRRPATLTTTSGGVPA
ncbi:MAG: cation-translocating P-type ATPase [Gammaproteobacteria bacterium]|nr:cation-translocating P-type ATPase [Gammaproteobacteria bacterium]